MSEQIVQDEPVPTPESPSLLTPSVGAVLKAAREARGLQVAEVAQTLKLGGRQVEALEADDWGGLPGHTFIRGFVRNYARLLAVDPAPLMASLDRLLEKPTNTLDVPDTAPAAMPTTSRGRDRLVVAFGFGLVAIAVAAYLLLAGDLSLLRSDAQSFLDSAARKEEPATPAPAVSEPAFPPGASAQQLIAPPPLAAPDAAAPATESPVAPAASPSVPPAGEGALPPQLRFVVEQPSWLEVRDRDGNVVFSQRLPAGSEQTVAGKGPLSVAIGYAPGVRLFARGQQVDLAPHTRGDVARLVLE